MNILQDELNLLITEIVSRVSEKKVFQIPVGVSNRHIHLSKEHVEFLFGAGYSLNKMKDLKQPGQFAANETVTLAGQSGVISNVRILGPARNQTQIEISRTDSFTLGITPPVRISGDIKKTPGIVIIGKNNTLVLQEGVVIAANHLHLSDSEAKEMNLSNGQKILIRSSLKSRKLFFADVIVRCGKEHLMEFHIDTDEANSAMLSSGDIVEIVNY